jgi:hypothetical protein
LPTSTHPAPCLFVLLQYFRCLKMGCPRVLHEGVGPSPILPGSSRYHLVKVDYGFEWGLDWRLISPVRAHNWHIDVNGSLQLVLSAIYDLPYLA